MILNITYQSNCFISKHRIREFGFPIGVRKQLVRRVWYKATIVQNGESGGGVMTRKGPQQSGQDLAEIATRFQLRREFLHLIQNNNNNNKRKLTVKPWPNGLASRRKFWTRVRLAFRLATHLRRLASTCDGLRGLAWTLVELKFGRK